MQLKDLLYKVQLTSVSGSTSVEITDVQTDSRAVTPGCCFVALRGTVTDGHQYIAQAVAAGARAVVAEKLPDSLATNVTYVEVKDAALACGWMSHTFYGEPSTHLHITGVTGTNGKTTVATLLYKLFTELHFTCGLISTVENKMGCETLPATHTTPDAVSLNKLLSQMVKAGCTHVFMECSSHAIHQQRIAGLQFAGAIFTNITHDHLDYHKTFDEYIRVKKSWFDSLPATAFALTNADDKRGNVMLQNTRAKKHTYALKTLATYKGKILESSLTGLQMMVDELEVYFKMIGEFNAYNLMAVYGAAVSLGADKQEALRKLSMLSGAEGRFECVQTGNRNVMGIVDYAHTPDALLNVLATINKMRQGAGQLITVVGCGGNRDTAKRPVMAQVACEHSNKVIFTSDNPRNEDPLAIIQDMESGVSITQKKKFISIPDRKEAIKTAVLMSHAEDIILVAGKGHEKYQEVKGVKYPFDDKVVLMDMLTMMDK
ncbi:MAG: UDP-N-acetylmuramoyl-L-alanyl-D-glutamate--2,6-diaminopimelate ligase [Ferruginibacter sp.]|nr:UDP-N-acetylmuramoyl-L-alanyl-D-glutamate--2,6-diaminopimelate ligase [Ferruginibacter sp.]